MRSHLKSVSAPKSWTVKKKQKFTIRPKPGAHSFNLGMPLSSALKLLGYAKTTREVNSILLNKEVFVDGKRRTNKDFLTGLMDSLQIGKDYYRILINKKGKLFFEKISKEEAKSKLCKIINKFMHKGKTFLGLHDGRTIQGSKEKTGETLEIEVPEQRIINYYGLEKGMLAYLISGKYIGETAAIEEVLPNKIVLRGKNSFEAPKKSIFVLGKKK